MNFAEAEAEVAAGLIRSMREGPIRVRPRRDQRVSRYGRRCHSKRLLAVGWQASDRDDAEQGPWRRSIDR